MVIIPKYVTCPDRLLSICCCCYHFGFVLENYSYRLGEAVKIISLLRIMWIKQYTLFKIVVYHSTFYGLKITSLVTYLSHIHNIPEIKMIGVADKTHYWPSLYGYFGVTGSVCFLSCILTYNEIYHPSGICHPFIFHQTVQLLLVHLYAYQNFIYFHLEVITSIRLGLIYQCRHGRAGDMCIKRYK